jgi:hypothetical protein
LFRGISHLRKNLVAVAHQEIREITSRGQLRDALDTALA